MLLIIIFIIILLLYGYLDNQSAILTGGRWSYSGDSGCEPVGGDCALSSVFPYYVLIALRSSTFVHVSMPSLCF